MHKQTFTALLAALVPMAPAYAKQELLKAVVADPYIEMHTGPGRSYPVFHVADRGAEIEVVKRRTEWFEVRTAKGVEGWVHETQLARTMDDAGEAVDIADPGWEDFEGRRWEMSIGFGDFDGASSITVTGAWRMSATLAAELVGEHISGDFSDGWLAGARLVHTPFPEWRVSPFVMLGTGALNVSPRASVVSTEDRTDQYGQVGIGARAWISERFIFRTEYSGYVVFTSRDENEEVEEWKAGFAFFF